MSPQDIAAALAAMSPEEKEATMAAMSPQDRAAALTAMSPEEKEATVAAMSPDSGSVKCCFTELPITKKGKEKSVECCFTEIKIESGCLYRCCSCAYIMKGFCMKEVASTPPVYKVYLILWWLILFPSFPVLVPRWLPMFWAYFWMFIPSFCLVFGF